MDDLRKRKSKEMLKNAFWRVLEKKKYTQIYMKDVTDEAGVNRKTFNSNYESMDDLMTDCIGELIHQMRRSFSYRRSDGSTDFAHSTREYTRFALENRHRLQLVFANQLDSVALHLWKKSLITPGILPTTPPTDNELRHDLYLNYAIYSCWGNLLWVLDHADLPLDKLVDEALDVYRTYLKDYYLLYETPEASEYIHFSD